MYHDIYENDTSESGFLRERDLPYKLSFKAFEEQVIAIDRYCKSKGDSQCHVVFSFDDGGKSFYKLAAPILEKYGHKGLFFISTQYIGEDTFLNAEEIKSLSQRGHIIGSHAHTHEHLYKLSDAQVDVEWKKSVEILSGITGAPIENASIPNGDSSKRVLDAAWRNGIKHIYTSEPTTKVGYYKDMEIIGRYVVLADSTSDYVMSIISKRSVRFKLSVKRAVIRCVKALLGDHYVVLKTKFLNLLGKNIENGKSESSMDRPM